MIISLTVRHTPFNFQCKTLLTLCKLHLQYLLQCQTVGRCAAPGVSVGSLHLVWLCVLHQIKRTVDGKQSVRASKQGRIKALKQTFVSRLIQRSFTDLRGEMGKEKCRKTFAF